MKCPYCGHVNTEVVDSREALEGESIRRRRECGSCKKRFTTYEEIEHADITVIKRDNKREPFDKNKILNGIMKACEKRSISRERMDDVTDRIEMKIRAQGRKEIQSRKIGDMVVKELFKLDPVAYIRFASVYENFDSPEQFRKAIQLFRKSSKNKNRKEA
ncbi:MAG: transcriptional regulator NrdR [Candidatus Micrarchaeota archaeon]|nr:transcriptional regulator NrdR [Candidatus Micrarchaeota archaeon]